jgi:hypothetical protein
MNTYTFLTSVKVEIQKLSSSLECSVIAPPSYYAANGTIFVFYHFGLI